MQHLQTDGVGVALPHIMKRMQQQLSESADDALREQRGQVRARELRVSEQELALEESIGTSARQ